MGNIQASPGVDKSDLIQLFALELPFDTQFERQLGQGKILKTAKVKSTSRDGHIVIKVYVKPILSQSNQQQMERLEESIEKTKQKYLQIQSKWTFDKEPGLIPLIPIENKDRVQSHLNRGYFLARQYFTYNLLDRFNTPPYLTIIEKKWITYQLLRCLKQAHDTHVVHGDIKSENILLTSWGWCFLTDFNPYKPDNTPVDNPFQWSQFFEDSRRPRCYLAPERFYTAKNDGSNAKLMPASDIFSLGCVIAEIFMDGQVLFDYGQLLKYKAHGFDEYDPTKLLAKKINDKNVRELIEHCINLEPKSRWTPQKYLDFYKDKIFPKYFDDLYELFKKFLSVTFSESDHKIKYLQKKYIDILKMVSNGNQSFHIPQLFKKENKKQGQTQALTPKMQSNMSLLSPLSSPTNGPQQANIPKLEIIMRQQKRQQQQQAIDENIADDSQNESGNDEFIRLTDVRYDEDQQPIQPQHKTSGLGLALQAQQQESKSNEPNNNGTLSPKSKTPLGSRRRRRSSGIGPSYGLASVVSAAYKGNDTRLLNDEDIEELTQRLNTMTTVGQTVNFLNKDGQLIVDMKEYNDNNQEFTFPSMDESKSNNNNINDSNVIRSKMDEKRKKVISIKSKFQQNKINELRIKKQKLMEKQLHGSAYDEEVDDDDENKQNNDQNEGNSNDTNNNNKNESNNNNKNKNSLLFMDDKDLNEFDGLILVSNVVCASLRNCRKASNRLIALEIINGFAEYLNDEIRLDRLVPYIRSLIHDDKKKIHEEHCVVVAKAIEVMSNILSRVIHVPSKYTRLFPDYILETLKLLVDARREEIIRIEIARQLANIALTGKYFIDYRDKDREITLENVDSMTINISKSKNDDNNNNKNNNKKEDISSSSSSPSTLTSDLFKLRTKVSQLIDPLFGVDQYPSVQRALLSNCTQLCEFLGAKFTESKLIPGLFTFFNRKEWQLRVSFLDVVVGISFYIGKQSLHKVLLPCLEECLNDARPAVVERCLEAFTSLTEMKIFESQLLLSRIQQIVPLVVHYSAWVRNACVNFLLTAANVLGDVRAHCRMLPLLEPYLQFTIVFINRQTLTASLKPPLSISTFNLLIQNLQKKNLNEIISTKCPDLYKDQPLYDGILCYIRCIKFIDESNFNSKSNKKNTIKHHHHNNGINNNNNNGYHNNGYNEEREMKEVHGIYHHEINNATLEQQDVKPPRLYSILIEPTVRIYIPNMPPVNQAIMLANQQSISGDFDDTDSAWQDLNYSIQSITSNGMLARSSNRYNRYNRNNDNNGNNNNNSNGNINNQNLNGVTNSTTTNNNNGISSRDRHPRQVDDIKIREALELPPATALVQDKLKYTQISKCSFYKNHQPPYMTQSVNGDWKPRGRVITQLTEHEDSVNVMRVSRDNLFVATASNDSTVKIWSCDKIHRCASIKSEQTYNHQKGEIISLAILDSSHSIASGSRDGTIHCFRVEYHDNSDSFAGLQYKFTLDPEEGGVVSMEHFNTFTESLIVFGTQAGNIHGWDIRRKKLSFALPMEPAMGAITSMCIGPSIHSVIVGTARGFIVVFDLRFEFPVQMWRHYDASPIVSLTVIDSKTIINHQKLSDLTHPCKGPLVLISTQRSNEICAFDLTTGTCRVRFRNSIAKINQIQIPRSTQSKSLSSPKENNNLLKKGIFSAVFGGGNSSSHKSKIPKQHRNTFASSIAGSTGNTQLGLKISQLPSVYPAALGQCPATRPFSLPSFEASSVLSSRKTAHLYSISADKMHQHKENDNNNDHRMKSNRSKTVDNMMNDGYKSSEKNRMKFGYSTRGTMDSSSSTGYIYNCGFVPTVLNRALNVNVIGDELEQLCSNFGNEYGGSTGVLISKDQFMISAGRDRVVRYWDLQQPQKSFRISNTSPNTIFTYNAYKDEKYKEVVFEELIEFEEEDYANLNDKQNSATIESSTSQLKTNGSHDAKSVHQDIITDLKAIEYPQNMLLTSSRNGIVKVWI